MELAGLSGAALYGGSWSEWSAQPDAAIELGAAKA
jgi:thiosulfate/3-mercaptopyruvate sulfurtransferase